jgi:hypothetical protein
MLLMWRQPDHLEIECNKNVFAFSAARSETVDFAFVVWTSRYGFVGLPKAAVAQQNTR